jgi:hypothetical protein
VALRITCWTNALWPMLHLFPLRLSYHLHSFGTVPSQFSGMPARSQSVASPSSLCNARRRPGDNVNSALPRLGAVVFYTMMIERTILNILPLPYTT